MIRRIALLAAVLPFASLSAQLPNASPEEASDAIRRALAAAEKVTVSEGLPHQAFEYSLLKSESKRKDTEKMGSYRFYTPAVAAKNTAVLKRLLSTSDTIQVFRGEKACGGFHPDYAVQWTDKVGSKLYALICFGCHEIIYGDGKHAYRYDFEDAQVAVIKGELERYAKKRPARTDPFPPNKGKDEAAEQDEEGQAPAVPEAKPEGDPNPKSESEVCPQ